ncbi:hypothetical protein B5X24_HaOG215066 [Helicoverpa armigera]|uniref:Uncharacterized protein n=1 Tax=Helicoverpa armigera TaxID=29058 RepID=A0A2W1B5R1_HELAM|nr:hypothetical protein B5X24_HaOG215066 [Helicoverpa armigera]
MRRCCCRQGLKVSLEVPLGGGDAPGDFVIMPRMQPRLTRSGLLLGEQLSVPAALTSRRFLLQHVTHAAGDVTLTLC